MCKPYNHKSLGRDKPIYFFLSLVIVLLVTSPAAHAQMEGIRVGDRIKITVPSVSKKSIIGTVGSTSSTAVELVTKKNKLVIPNTSIEELYLRQGKKGNAGKGALIGALTGGLVLGITTAATNPTPDPCDPYIDFLCGAFEISDAEAFAMGALVGTLGGAAIGALIGAGIQTDRWKRVPVMIAVGLAPSHKDHLAVNPTVSFRLTLK